MPLTEEEIKKREAEIDKREKRIVQAEKGLSMRIAKDNETRKMISNQKELLESLKSAGINSIDELGLKLDAKKKSSSSSSNYDLLQIKDEVKNTVKENLDPYLELMKKTNNNLVKSQSKQTFNQLKESIKTKLPYAFKYVNAKEDSIKDDFLEFLTNFPDNSPEEFFEIIEKNVKDTMSSVGMKLEDMPVVKSEKKSVSNNVEETTEKTAKDTKDTKEMSDEELKEHAVKVAMSIKKDPVTGMVTPGGESNAEKTVV